MLAKPPEDIRVGEIVALLEGRSSLTDCSESPEVCNQVDTCLTRYLWKEAAKAMFEKLNSFTLSDLIEMGKGSEKGASQKDRFTEFGSLA
jgi:Rrf2 family iron-sulfur cluster assembly transcriptional regulator